MFAFNPIHETAYKRDIAAHAPVPLAIVSHKQLAEAINKAVGFIIP